MLQKLKEKGMSHVVSLLIGIIIGAIMAKTAIALIKFIVFGSLFVVVLILIALYVQKKRKKRDEISEI
jgi:uncharacterized membrane protein YfcA